MNSIRIIVSGNVQGVYYRKHTKEEADRLGLSGFVENMDDGTVKIEVSGDLSEIDTFVEWCWKGSPDAKVKNVESEGIEDIYMDGFKIIK